MGDRRRRNQARRWGAAAWAAAVLSLLGHTAVADPPELRVKAVFDIAQPRAPLPIAVEVTATAQPAVGRLRVPLDVDSYGFPSLVYECEVDVPVGGSKTYWLTLHPLRATLEFAVEYVEPNGRVWRKDAKVRQEAGAGERVVAVVEPGRAALRYLQREPQYDKPAAQGGGAAVPSAPSGDEGETKLKRRGVKVANLIAGELPRDPAAYGGLHALVVQGAELTATDPAVRGAIAAWVRQGGRLVMAGGAASRGLYQDPVLGPLAPVTVQGLTEVDADDLRGLRQWSAGAPIGPAATRYVIGRAQPTAGETLLQAGGVPLVQRAKQGRGEVVYVGAPLDAPPLRDLPDVEGFWDSLLRLERLQDAATPRSLALWFWAWQMRAALEIGGVETPSLILVGAFLLTYLLVLVPGQYLILRRLRRRELAWLLTPAIVAVFSIGAYLIGTTLKGRRAVCQSISLVDAVSGETAAQAVTTAVIYSPAKARFEITMPPGSSVVRELHDAVPEYAYYGSPEGILSDTGQLRILDDGQRQRLEHFDVPMWAARVLGFTWHVSLPGRVHVEDLGGPTQRMRVRNGLPVPLYRAVVVQDGRLWKFGELAPGKVVEQTQPVPVERALRHVLSALPPDPRQAAWSMPVVSELVGSTDDFMASTYRYDDRDGVDWTAGTTLWAFVEPADGPLSLGEHESDQRTLWLLRVVLEPAP